MIGSLCGLSQRDLAMWKPKRKAVLLGFGIAAILVAVVCLLVPREARGLVRYYAWKQFSSKSGTGQHVDVNDVRIYYEVHGTGEPLVLLHGGTAFIESFYEQIPLLARNFKVIALDSRAHGRSTDSPQPLSYKAMADDTLKVVNALGIDSFFVVGWSDGGIIGLDIAMTAPKRMKKLVAIGSNARVDGLTDEALNAVKNMSADAEGLRGLRQFYTLIAPSPSHFPELIRKIQFMWLSQPNYSADDLRSIQASTLLILGDHDAVRLDHGKEMAKLIPRCELLVIGDASHWVPLERPLEVNAAIVRFLKRI